MIQAIEKNEYVVTDQTTHLLLNTLVGTGIVNVLTSVKIKGKFIDKGIVGALQNLEIPFDESMLNANLIVHIDLTNNNKVPNNLFAQLEISGGANVVEFQKLKHVAEEAQQSVTFSYYIKIKKQD